MLQESRLWVRHLPHETAPTLMVWLLHLTEDSIGAFEEIWFVVMHGEHQTHAQWFLLEPDPVAFSRIRYRQTPQLAECPLWNLYPAS